MNTNEGVRDPLGDPKDGHILTRAIIDTIREPLIVLDEDLRIIAASRSFYKKFGMSHENVHDKMFYELGDGEWDIPQLRNLLEKVIPEDTTVEDYEVVHDLHSGGSRSMLLNAREILYDNGNKKMLLSIQDATAQRQVETEMASLIEQKNGLLREMHHRIANSLQLIASLLLLKAGTVASDEARLHLEDAHGRILSVATVQKYLDPAELMSGRVDVAPYLVALCEGLEKSMIGGRKPITLQVDAGEGSATADQAISFGLLTTELVINALKHAFPEGEGQIRVSYSSKNDQWRLSVEDDGVGYVKNADSQGLGTNIVASLAKQLRAELSIASSRSGTSVTLDHSDLRRF